MESEEPNFSLTNRSKKEARSTSVLKIRESLTPGYMTAKIRLQIQTFRAEILENEVKI